MQRTRPGRHHWDLEYILKIKFAAGPPTPRRLTKDRQTGSSGRQRQGARGKAREAALGQRIGELETQNKRIAGLEADNASLTAAEVAELRKRPRLPPPPATLQHLIRLLGNHEKDRRGP